MSPLLLALAALSLATLGACDSKKEEMQDKLDKRIEELGRKANGLPPKSPAPVRPSLAPVRPSPALPEAPPPPKDAPPEVLPEVDDPCNKEGLDACRAAAKKACDEGKPYGCFRLGILHETKLDPNENRNNAVAIALYEKACAAKHATSCSELGMVYHSGRGGAGRDLDKAIAQLQKSCDLGLRRACIQVGIVNRHKAKEAASPGR